MAIGDDILFVQQQNLIARRNAILDKIEDEEKIDQFKSFLKAHRDKYSRMAYNLKNKRKARKKK